MGLAAPLRSCHDTRYSVSAYSPGPSPGKGTAFNCRVSLASSNLELFHAFVFYDIGNF